MVDTEKQHCTDEHTGFYSTTLFFTFNSNDNIQTQDYSLESTVQQGVTTVINNGHYEKI